MIKTLLFFQDYIERYRGQLVNSDHFIDMVYQKFGDKIPETQTDLKQDWLHSPGIPDKVRGLTILQVEATPAYLEVLDCYKEISELIREHKKRQQRKGQNLELKLHSSYQTQLLFNNLINRDSLIPNKVLLAIKDVYKGSIASNLDVGHKWCELVIKNKLRSEYHFIETYVTQHQSMGVYIYGEMFLSKVNATFSS